MYISYIIYIYMHAVAIAAAPPLMAMHGYWLEWGSPEQLDRLPLRRPSPTCTRLDLAGVYLLIQLRCTYIAFIYTCVRV